MSGETSVSIILPTYDWEAYLREALTAILAQSWTRWSLTIVDDGSTDRTRSVAERFIRDHPDRRIEYVYQKNGGPARARSVGRSVSSGTYVAFYDSDDLWLPHHLRTCVAALERLSLDWVYAACRRVDARTGEVVLDSTFRSRDGRPNALFGLKGRMSDGVFVIDDDGLAAVQITKGIDSGFQNSVIRRSALEGLEIPDLRVGEDRAFILMAIKAGLRFGFVDDVHVEYRVHDGNISDTNARSPIHTRILAVERLVESYTWTLESVSLTRPERRLLVRTLADTPMWELGYSLYWMGGERDKALRTFVHAIRLRPFKPSRWKTLLACLLRSAPSPART